MCQQEEEAKQGEPGTGEYQCQRVHTIEDCELPEMGTNPNPDLQIQYAIQNFVKLYLDFT